MPRVIHHTPAVLAVLTGGGVDSQPSTWLQELFIGNSWDSYVPYGALCHTLLELDRSRLRLTCVAVGAASMTELTLHWH